MLSLKLQAQETSIAENLYFYLPDKYIDWPSPRIDYEMSQVGRDKALITFRSDALVRDIRIDVTGALALSDNFLNLLPKTNMQIEVQFADALIKPEPAIEFTSVAAALAD